MKKIRVLIADDHAVLRAGLRMLINAQPDMEVAGESTQASEAERKANELTPDVLILDLSMPGGNSLKSIKRLRQECPQTQSIVLTMHDDPAYLRAALAAGASGYVVKTAGDAELMTAIRTVHEGRSFLDCALTDGNVHNLFGAQAAGKKVGQGGPSKGLSQREEEVLQFLAEGYTNKEAAERLFLSVKTVETYRSRIADKLGLRSRADIVRFAIELGLIGPGQLGPPCPIA